MSTKSYDFDSTVKYVNDVLDYGKYLTPVNLIEENEKFSKSYKHGIVYNPQYQYCSYDDINFDELRFRVDHTISEAGLFSSIFEKYLSFLRNLISFYESIGNKDLFTKFSKLAFGMPSAGSIVAAKEFLANSNESTNSQNNSSFTGQELAECLRKKLVDYGYDWSVIVDKKMSTKVTVDPDRKTINVNGRLGFSENDIKRLSAHEIDTHVVRAENGFSQPYNIFGSGLANALSTEEGLAVYSEELCGVLDLRTLKIYAGRVLAVSMIESNTFYEIVKGLDNYLDFSDALYITQRVKRGLINTAEMGGFSKDYVYYEGYYNVKSFFHKGDFDSIAKLYVGSVGIEDLSVISDLLNSGLLRYPTNIPQHIMQLKTN